ncbi:hypothetical protein BDV39DRAFT_203340 [Aspergillus sergii]|uniref:Alpha/Beta hydrolase protein n=1 Tax=Aspergillus sergii TaxID=1034303 RepID=A0A5N6XAI1_9EURO|nr:hypothetical protein BDV39DRAFT_203340 [Aspergillus sergii]
MRITEGSTSGIVPAGVLGNLEISGPVVFKSYFNNPTATEESFSKALYEWATLAFALQSMAVDYDPSGSIASMDVFYCISLVVVASKKQWRDDHLSKWMDFTRSESRFHEVGGAHYTMLGPEHVFNFQKTLRAALDARGI